MGDINLRDQGDCECLLYSDIYSQSLMNPIGAGRGESSTLALVAIEVLMQAYYM